MIKPYGKAEISWHKVLESYVKQEFPYPFHYFRVLSRWKIVFFVSPYRIFLKGHRYVAIRLEFSNNNYPPSDLQPT